MGLKNLHELWAVPAELGIAIYLLQKELGISFLAPTVIPLISTACVVGISTMLEARRKLGMKESRLVLMLRHQCLGP